MRKTTMEPISERQRRLQYHNERKPVYKTILGATLRTAFGMMKWMVKAAFKIPGLVKRAARASRPTTPSRSVTSPPAGATYKSGKA